MNLRHSVYRQLQSQLEEAERVVVNLKELIAEFDTLFAQTGQIASLNDEITGLKKDLDFYVKREREALARHTELSSEPPIKVIPDTEGLNRGKWVYRSVKDDKNAKPTDQ